MEDDAEPEDVGEPMDQEEPDHPSASSEARSTVDDTSNAFLQSSKL